MTREEVLTYVLETYGTEPDHPWQDENAVLRHETNAKWYGLLMNVGRDKLGLSGEGTADVLNVKGDPMLIASLRTQYGYRPAYHMHKEKWITVLLCEEETPPREAVLALIDMSRELTRPKVLARHKVNDAFA